MRLHTPPTALPRLAAIVTAGVLATGCGGDAQEAAPAENGTPTSTGPTDDPEHQTPEAEETAPETELTIERSLGEEGDDADLAPDGFEPGTWTLTCAPAGGDHPEPEAACADLEEVGVEGFEEVPDGQMCTHIYGGPQTARVSGHVAGTEVDTTFGRANGCEIDRYDSMGTVLAP
ncbi:SSI family serine proteinase inhibitor [Halostreptopolyspora alba]|uniref:Subtilisin inhibitor domain-containing protein n=1 Tax=Halostreptopolyspora alba TaxID=2487137 RepID=A0A3N0E6D7_9ACTN|nr:hypothetical protein EFW17_16485 [Nocardiopsaceae bacterium YIM 96095]